MAKQKTKTTEVVNLDLQILLGGVLTEKGEYEALVVLGGPMSETMAAFLLPGVKSDTGNTVTLFTDDAEALKLLAQTNHVHVVQLNPEMVSLLRPGDNLDQLLSDHPALLAQALKFVTDAKSLASNNLVGEGLTHDTLRIVVYPGDIRLQTVAAALATAARQEQLTPVVSLFTLEHRSIVAETTVEPTEA